MTRGDVQYIKGLLAIIAANTYRNDFAQTVMYIVALLFMVFYTVDAVREARSGRA